MKLTSNEKIFLVIILALAFVVALNSYAVLTSKPVIVKEDYAGYSGSLYCSNNSESSEPVIVKILLPNNYSVSFGVPANSTNFSYDFTPILTTPGVCPEQALVEFAPEINLIAEAVCAQDGFARGSITFDENGNVDKVICTDYILQNKTYEL